jgi:hypothetical protein
VRRSPRQARFLGLWTASWLFVLLLGLLLRVGDLTLQWPALLFPVAWALLALTRGRGRRSAPRRPPEEDFWPPEDESWPPEDDEAPVQRRPPPTRELPWLPEVPRHHGEGHRGDGHRGEAHRREE